MDKDLGYEIFLNKREELLKFNGESLTETDTRSKIIDILFKDVFHWTEDCLVREPHIEAGYMDYVFNNEEGNSFILEAKSTKVLFEKYSSDKKPKSLKSKNIETSDKNLFNAIEQVRNYCKQENKPYFVVSNGLDLCIGKVFLNGKDENDIIIYQGYECIKNNFADLYIALNPESTGMDKVLELITKSTDMRLKPGFQKRIVDNLVNTNPKKGENDYSLKLLPLLTKYFDEIIDKSEFSKKVYCKVDDANKYSDIMKSYLKSRLSALGLPIEYIDKTPEGTLERSLDNIKNTEGHLFILFGKYGIGKTTFINQFINQSISKEMQKDIFWINCDFQSWYVGNESVEDKICDCIEKAILDKFPEVLEDEVLDIYKEEISRKKRGPMGKLLSEQRMNEEIFEFIEKQKVEKRSHLNKVLNYIKNVHQFEPIFIFDNIDQHSEKVQEEVVFYAISQTKNNNYLAILSLRDETYWDLSKKKPLDAYGNYTATQVVPPTIQQVLNRRIDFVLENEELSSMVTADDFGGKTVKFDTDKVFTLFKDSINKPDNNELLDSLSNFSIRRGLKMFKSLVLSGHIDLNNIIQYSFKDQEAKVIPPDKFIKGIGLGAEMYYKSTKSEIFNMFNLYEDGYYSHFVSFIILEKLKSLEIQVGEAPLDAKDFVPINILLQSIYPYCINERNLRNILKELIKYELVDSEIGTNQIENINDFSFVKITPAGRFYKEKMIMKHQYLEMVIFDTPIKNPKIYKELITLQDELQNCKRFEKKWEKKFLLVNTFIKYLRNEMNEELLNEKICVDFLEDIEKSIKSEQEEIRKKLEAKADKDNYKL